MSLQMELMLVLGVPAALGFLYAVIWPNVKTWWYYEMSRKRKEWHK